jgi:septal ring factor EnvC (AmiA/AmiB activator)
MATQLPPSDPPSADELGAEHKQLKEQTARLRREHERLHIEGGSRREHQKHLRDLRFKKMELERHVERLKNSRKPSP